MQQINVSMTPQLIVRQEGDLFERLNALVADADKDPVVVARLEERNRAKANVDVLVETNEKLRFRVSEISNDLQALDVEIREILVGDDRKKIDARLSQIGLRETERAVCERNIHQINEFDLPKCRIDLLRAESEVHYARAHCMFKMADSRAAKVAELLADVAEMDGVAQIDLRASICGSLTEIAKRENELGYQVHVSANSAEQSLQDRHAALISMGILSQIKKEQR